MARGQKELETSAGYDHDLLKHRIQLTQTALLPRRQLPLLPRHHLLQLLPLQPARRLQEASHPPIRLRREAQILLSATGPVLVHNARSLRILDEARRRKEPPSGLDPGAR